MIRRNGTAHSSVVARIMAWFMNPPRPAWCHRVSAQDPEYFAFAPTPLPAGLPPGATVNRPLAPAALLPAVPRACAAALLASPGVLSIARIVHLPGEDHPDG